MQIAFREAKIDDAALLVRLYNAAFYADFLRYGACLGYGRSEDDMARSIRNYPKQMIFCDGVPVGVISAKETAPGIYEIGCLCVIPAYQGCGIGTAAFRFMEETLCDKKQITLITPADKEENVRFYTEKCGFSVDSIERDGDVQVYRFVKNYPAQET